MAKLHAVKGNNVDYIRKSVLAALNSDPEIKLAFMPGDLGFKAGAGAIVVVMSDNEQYRLNLAIVQNTPASE